MKKIRRITRIQISIVDKDYNSEKSALGGKYTREVAKRVITALANEAGAKLINYDGAAPFVLDSSIEASARIVDEFQIPTSEEVAVLMREVISKEKAIKEEIGRQREELAQKQKLIHADAECIKISRLQIEEANKALSEGLIAYEVEELKRIRQEGELARKELDELLAQSAKESAELARMRADVDSAQKSAKKKRDAYFAEIEAHKEKMATESKTNVADAASLLVMLEPEITTDRARAFLLIADKENLLAQGGDISTNELKSILLGSIEVYRSLHKSQ